MSATATITIGETRYSEHTGRFASITGECSECGHKVWTGGSPDRDWSGLLDDHLRQHEPGRALDIEVDWTPSAWCTVCDDGGDVRAEDDGLECVECHTRWDIDGSNGERADVEIGGRSDV